MQTETVTYQSLLAELETMHTYCRPHGTLTDHAFCDRYIAPIAGARQDDHGNWIVTRGPADTPILFSSHTDTVHRAEGMQTVTMNDQYVLSLSKRSARHSTCLGADDTAGVFMLRQMIDRGIPGTYIFHYGEERGGIGSRALARSSGDYLKRFTHAIAFDRAGTGDIITHQGGRTASDVFARALSDELNAMRGFTYAGEHGMYTDTAEYADIIPECSNVSVGYAHAHSSRETLDCLHLLVLLEAVSVIDFSALPVDRDPSAFDDSDWLTIGGSRLGSLTAPDWRAYDWMDDRSDAIDAVIKAEDRDDDDPFDRAVYLSRDYADVQDALLRVQMDQRRRFMKGRY